METIQVIGYKGSGKTTTAITLIQFFAKQGFQVGSLKHHGHGGVPDGLNSTDSFRHLEAGAIVSSVEGEGLLQVIQQKPWELDKLVTMYEWINVDVLLIEGYKKADYRKIVLVNHEEDLALLEQSSNIIAVVSSLPLEKKTSYPIFKPTELKRLCEWVFDKLMQKGT